MEVPSCRSHLGHHNFEIYENTELFSALVEERGIVEGIYRLAGITSNVQVDYVSLRFDLNFSIEGFEEGL